MNRAATCDRDRTGWGRRVCLLVALVAVGACSKDSDKGPAKVAESSSAPARTRREAVDPSTVETTMPAERPTPFEAEYISQTGTGDRSQMLKLTDKGIRYSVGDKEHRVTLSYAAPTSELDRVYDAMREVKFDQIQTQPSREMSPGGTTLRLLVGSEHHSAADMGRIYPRKAWTAAYDEAARVMESLLPSDSEAKAASLAIRWAPEMKGHRASLDMPLGPLFAGIRPEDETGADLRIALTEAKPIKVTLRYGPPVKVHSVDVDPTTHAGVRVTWDAETKAPKLETFDAAALKAADDAKRAEGDVKAGSRADTKSDAKPEAKAGTAPAADSTAG